MPLIINQKKHPSTTSIETIIAAVKKLPEPIIASGYADIPPLEKVGLCLQGEMIYVDKTDPTQEMQYIGSKRVMTCIVLYIYSDTDHLCIHVDNTTNFDLTKEIEQFKDKSNIRVMLAGGLPKNEISTTNLKSILQKLLQAAEHNNIAIVSQKLNDRNILTQDKKYEHVFTGIIKRMRNLYFLQYNKILDCAFFSERHPLELKYKDCNDIASQMFIAGVFTAFLTTDNPHHPNEIEFNKIFKKHIPDENTFLKLAKNVFSKQGFAQFDKSFSGQETYGKALDSFVFDITSSNILTISHNTPTPLEAQREIGIFFQTSYAHCYNTKIQQYIAPRLNPAFISRCKKITDNVLSKTISRSQLAELFNTEYHAPLFEAIAEYILYSSLTPKPQKKLATFRLFDKPINDSYSQTNAEHSLITRLNEMTGLSFIAKERKHPKHITDALVYATNSKGLTRIKQQLDLIGIDSNLLQTPNHPDGQYCLCIPAINLSKHAERIQCGANLLEAAEKKLG